MVGKLSSAGVPQELQTCNFIKGKVIYDRPPFCHGHRILSEESMHALALF